MPNLVNSQGYRSWLIAPGAPQSHAVRYFGLPVSQTYRVVRAAKPEDLAQAVLQSPCTHLVRSLAPLKKDDYFTRQVSADALQDEFARQSVGFFSFEGAFKGSTPGGSPRIWDRDEVWDTMHEYGDQDHWFTANFLKCDACQIKEYFLFYRLPQD